MSSNGISLHVEKQKVTQEVIFTPPNEKLKRRIVNHRVGTVIKTTIDITGNVSEILYEKFDMRFGRIMAQAKDVQIFSLVHWLNPNATCLYDMFRKYDGSIYFMDDKFQYLQTPKPFLALSPNENVVIFTAY